MRGLGVVVNPNGSYYVPGYCSWLPFSSFADACKPPTHEQFIADQMSSLGPAAKANPAVVADLNTAWGKVVADQCAANPADCADYETALKYPNLSAAVGTGPIETFEYVKDAAGRALDSVKTNWGLILGVGAVAIFAVTTIFQPGARRYGR